MLNYDPKKDKINPKRCQICVQIQRLEEKISDVIFPNLSRYMYDVCAYIHVITQYLLARYWTNKISS